MVKSRGSDTTTEYGRRLSDSFPWNRFNSNDVADFPCNFDVKHNLYIGGDMYFGDTIADTLTLTGPLNMGTNSTPLVLTAGTPLITLYTTNAGTSGGTNAEPLYVKSVLTGDGQVGGRSYFLVTSNVASGGWINAVKADIEFGAAGSTSGLASAFCAEMTLPNQTVPSGHYYPMEIEWIGGTNTATAGDGGSGTGCIYINATGTVTDFDDHAGLFWLNGITAGAGHILSADSTTIKAYVTSSMTSRYLLTSRTENTLTLGVSGTELSYTAGAPIIALYATNAGTSGGTNAEPFLVDSTLTSAGQVGGRSRFNLNVEAALGGWANAVKGATTFNSSGSVTGLGSVFCGDLTLSAGTSSGTYTVFEGNIIAESSASTGTLTSFIRLNADGADEDTIDSNAVLFDFGDALDAASGKFINTDITTHTAYGGIPINIDGVGVRYIALVSN